MDEVRTQFQVEGIEEIDAQSTPILTRLVALATHPSFEYVCALSDEESIAKQTYKGIYRIDIFTSGENDDFESFLWVECTFTGMARKLRTLGGEASTT
jgi:hypothetical protein